MQAGAHTNMSRVCVIGAGLGGLALAIRLQSAGIETTLVEALDRPGGCARGWQQDGFTVDTGPAVITDPAGLQELWHVSGQDMASDVQLLPITPLCRYSWPDGAQFDLVRDEVALRARIARLAPGDLAGYEEFVAYAAQVQTEGFRHRPPASYLHAANMISALPALLRLQFWRSLYGRVAGLVKSERLRQVLSSSALLVGGNPLTVSATYAIMHKREKDSGVWVARGGMGQLAAGMAALFQRLGGTLRLSDAAIQVVTLGNRASAVQCASGWSEHFDAIASDGDVVHSYGTLLSDNARGPTMARRLARKHWSPGVFVVHFTLDGAWPGIAHQTVLLGPRYAGLLADIFDYGVLPHDGLIWLTHPTVTDPSVAPPGKSLFRAVMPVAHLGKLPIDWGEVGPRLQRRILDEVGRRYIPDIHDRVITSWHSSPRDHAQSLNAWQGSAFGLEPLPSQSAWLRTRQRDAVIGNFYLVGAGTHPGAGVASVVSGAQGVARLMIEDLAQ
jgi:phytoene desaturase